MQRFITTAAVAFCTGIAAVSAFAEAEPPAGTSPADAAAGKFIEQLDTDASGGVSLDEALAPPTENFKQTDQDGDGFISAEEASAEFKKQVPPEMLKAMEERGMPDPGQNLVDNLDKDGDGKINLDEKLAPSKASFGAMDSSGDGQADQAEASAYFEAMRVQMQERMQQMQEQMQQQQPPAPAE
jgi:hypothetical protein